MPVRTTSQNWGQPTAQPNELYSTSNDIFWGNGLQFGDTHEQGMFSFNNDYELFLSNYNVNLQQAFNPETYGGPGETHHLGYQESSATTMHPSLFPTPLPVTMGIGFPPLGESPSEGSDTNSQSNWESEVDVDLSMRVRELQLEYAMPSTSNSAAGPGEPKKSRKKEESGVCAQCNQTFSRKSDVRRHENTAHGREVHACPLCNIICSRKDALQRHIRDQH